jgi:putative transposase
VIEVRSKWVSVRGAPTYLRSDNGPEFVSRAVLQGLSKAGIETAPIDPGKPWQNQANESFNGKFRDECLGMQEDRNYKAHFLKMFVYLYTTNAVMPHPQPRTGLRQAS